MNKKWIGVIVVVLGLIVSLIVSQKHIVITVGIFAGSNWDVPNGDTYQIIDDAIERFENQYPYIDIQYDSGILKEDYSLWLSEELIQGEEPDVYMVLSEDFNTLSSLGALENLNKWINQDDIDMSQYYESTLLSGQYKNNQYALPYESNPTLMFVNKTLLKNKGIDMPDNEWTIDDFYKICQQVTDLSKQQYGSYNYSWLDSVYSYGASLFDDEGMNCYIDEEEVKDALSFMQKLNALNEGHTVTSVEFDKGQVAFSPMSFAQYRTYKPYPWRVKKYANFEWDCVKMPSVTSKQQSGQVSSLLMGLSSRSQNKKEAWEFLKLLCYNDETQLDLFQYSQGISSLKNVTQSNEALSLLKEETADSQVDLSLLNEVMENSVSHSQFKKYNSALDLMDTKVQQILNDETDLDIALISLQKEMNQYLKE